ncbi:AGAP004733-PA-like protein [Anopheles sinensis]|uniref:AGAP004733-PA-like protein n=1 Tax=Anopheles sinensis TaxID=74873 RepID=A0A084VZU5_ANOSI|nr:AGAP004733-PA-like protein [Anopheles sinensis]
MFGTWCIPNSAIPPDVILEVGPQPCSTSYAAHGSLLALHSGYLRAALRTLEPPHNNTTFGSLRRANLQTNPHIATSVSMANSPMALNGANTATTILHLPNVTTEQFMPLLTYMYTGYLDLTVDNIFGVLLATHLLHMPRALELCRSFLSSSSTLSVGNNATLAAPPGLPDLERTFYVPKSATVTDVPKLVRPIASKALTTVGLHFIAPPTASQISLLPSAPFRSLGPSIISPVNPLSEQPHDATRENHESPSQSPISVTQYEDESVTLQTPQLQSIENEDTMDSITVDSKCDDNENEPTLQNEFASDPQRSAKANMICKGETLTNRTRKHPSVVSQSSVKRHRSVESATDESGTGNGVIIDIASCDGPVRFRRVLNVMYGCNKNNKSPHYRTTDNVGLSEVGEEVKKIVTQHRSLRYASSFHQQVRTQHSRKPEDTLANTQTKVCSH